VQSKPTGKLLKIMKVIADGSFRPQPIRLGHANRRAEFDLNKLGRGCHGLL
jgi:hypothetical protein